MDIILWNKYCRDRLYIKDGWNHHAPSWHLNHWQVCFRCMLMHVQATSNFWDDAKKTWRLMFKISKSQVGKYAPGSNSRSYQRHPSLSFSAFGEVCFTQFYPLDSIILYAHFLILIITPYLVQCDDQIYQTHLDKKGRRKLKKIMWKLNNRDTLHCSINTFC